MIMETIRQAVAAVPRSDVLDFKPVQSNGAFYSTMAVVQTGTYQTRQIDIPIRSVIALNRSDDQTFLPGDTWRSILFDRLHGNDWLPEVIDYFEQPIGERPFPASHASRPLELSATGGAVSCSNGNHRVVGAICWLAATQGDHAVLRGVTTHIWDVNETTIRQLLVFRDAGATVSVSPGIGLQPPRLKVVENGGRTMRLYTYGKGVLRPDLPEFKQRWSWLPQKEVPVEYRQPYTNIPEVVFTAWRK